MSDILELKSMLQKHIDDSSKGQLDIKQSIARIEVHGEYTKKTLTEHETVLEKLQSAHNKQKGAIWVLSLIGLGGVAEIIRNIIK